MLPSLLHVCMSSCMPPVPEPWPLRILSPGFEPTLPSDLAGFQLGFASFCGFRTGFKPPVSSLGGSRRFCLLLHASAVTTAVAYISCDYCCCCCCCCGVSAGLMASYPRQQCHHYSRGYSGRSVWQHLAAPDALTVYSTWV